MNCPHCQKELPENYGARWCPFCGKDLPASATYAVEAPPSASLKPVKINWLIFISALLIPPMLTMLSALLTGSRNDPVSPVVGLCGGVAAGIYCGVVLGLRFGETSLGRIVCGVLLSMPMVIVCVMLCFFGCTIGGYQIRLN